MRVRTPQPDRLATLLADKGGGEVDQHRDGILTVAGLDAAQIGELAAEHGLPTHELSVQEASLEARFLELTSDDVESRGSTPG